jgi:16S rRNA (guanine527-N7)-methyltransferase
VADAAPHTRVTSVTAANVVRRQYAESLEALRIARCFTSTTEPYADVGSGGGYPGLVVAIIQPATPVTLVEPLQKRARLLESMAAELGLANVRVLPDRAEDAGRGPLRERCALVTARAVAELRELLEYTVPLAGPGGWIVLPKGSGAEAEVEEAARAFDELNCAHRATVPMRPEVSDSGMVVVVEKLGPTPEKYPRRAGIPGKRPL